MAHKLLSIEVRGKRHSWCFTFYGDPKHIPEWEADGLTVVEVVNIIPGWLPTWAIRPWVFLQDVFNFKRPWK